MITLPQLFALTFAVEIPVLAYGAWLLNRRDSGVHTVRVLSVWTVAALITVPTSHYMSTEYLRRFDYSVRVGLMVAVAVVVESIFLAAFTKIPRNLVFPATLAVNTITFLMGLFLISFGWF